MIEVEKYLFDQMVEYFNGLSKFVTAVGKNELRKISEISAGLQAQKASSAEFLDLIVQKSKSPESAQSARSMTKFKKPLKELVKYTSAIQDGIDNGELNLTRFRNYVKTLIQPLKDTMVTHAASFVPTGVTDEELEEQLKYATQKNGHRDSLKILRSAIKELAKSESKKEAPLPVPDAEAKKAVKVYMKAQSKLPSSLKGRQFLVVKMPVVPFGAFQLMHPTFLRKTGLEYQHIADSFVVLENQELLAFDIGAATEYKGRKAALQSEGLKSRKRATKHQTLAEGFVIDILDRINELPGAEEYTLVSSHFEYHPSNPRIVFAWLMPKRTFRMFDRAGNMADFTWGFPWSREAASIL